MPLCCVASKNVQSDATASYVETAYVCLQAEYTEVGYNVYHTIEGQETHSESIIRAFRVSRGFWAQVKSTSKEALKLTALTMSLGAKQQL